jgi:hypothetical protein
MHKIYRRFCFISQYIRLRAALLFRQRRHEENAIRIRSYVSDARNVSFCLKTSTEVRMHCLLCVLRQSLRQIQKANQGNVTCMDRLFDVAYGRVGVQKHLFLTVSNYIGKNFISTAIIYYGGFLYGCWPQC